MTLNLVVVISTCPLKLVVSELSVDDIPQLAFALAVKFLRIILANSLHSHPSHEIPGCSCTVEKGLCFPLFF